MNDATQKHYPFDTGMPTAPDVAALQKRFPDLKLGERVPYADVESVVGAAWNSPRFKSVTNVWRAREQESGRVLVCVPGRAFVVATADDITGETPAVLRTIGRKSRKHRQRLTTIRPTSELQRRTVEHHGLLMLAIERDAKAARHKILPPNPVADLPRIGPRAG